MTSIRTATHKPFLPGRANVLVPLHPRDDAPAALTLYSPSRRRAMLVRDAAWWLLRRAGAWALPWRDAPWCPPMACGTWEILLEGLQKHVGPRTSLAFYRPRDHYRNSFAMLWMRNGDPAAFVKVAALDSATGPPMEWHALAAVAAADPRTFRAPRPIALVEQDGWRAIAMTALPSARHGPARTDPSLIGSEISRCLTSLPRPEGVAEHWTPMHGDLTPWNLRSVDAGLPMLLDWADAGWGPPGADEVLYRATLAALEVARPPRWSHDLTEARHYWLRQIPLRTTSLDALNNATLACLEGKR
jgi:hypothetical protein